MRLAGVSGMVTGDAPFFTVPIVTVPEVFANVY